jgi:hypothetical protein
MCDSRLPRPPVPLSCAANSLSRAQLPLTTFRINTSTTPRKCSFYGTYEPAKPFRVGTFRKKGKGSGSLQPPPTKLPKGNATLMQTVCLPFIFNQLQDAPPATLFFSHFCIVAGGGGGPSPFSIFTFQFPPLAQFHVRRSVPYLLCSSLATRHFPVVHSTYQIHARIRP